MFARIRKWLTSSPDDELIESLKRLNDELEGLNKHLDFLVPETPRLSLDSSVEKQAWEFPSFQAQASADLELNIQPDETWLEDRRQIRVTTIH